MGKGKKQRGGKKGEKKGGGARDVRPEVDRWKDLPETNLKFEEYYKAQKVLPESEWDAFMASLHEPLPTTFRITGCREIASALNQMIKDTFVPYLSGLEHEGLPLSPPKSLDWYPNGYAWQLNIAKQHIRKNEAFRKFQHFLVYETDAGNISRQEAVSMIPPLLLDVQPHHFVLDVCAAPGSKSVQLLEALHALPPPSTSSTADVSPPRDLIPKGLLIANDSDAKRCHMLVHQSLHRIPASGMMVTNHDAGMLPGLRLPNVALPANMLVADGDGELDGEEEEETKGGKKGTRVKQWLPLLFDRILADVPCSGDGTLRKNVGIWRDWSVANGTGLHALQLRILLRAINLLKPGGRLVYSTCSLNPIENEAVVSAALAICPEMSLLDVPELLPSLLRRPGLTTWEVRDSNNKEIKYPVTTDDYITLPTADGKKKKKWARTLWPNGKEAERGLERCLRIYPHLQDTGAFFVSVMVKAEVVVKADVSETKAATSEVIKRTISDRPASPVAGEPSSKRVKSDDVLVEDDTVLVDASLPIITHSAPKVDAVDDEIDLSSLPADIVGTVSKVPSEFKEEPYIYLSAEDEQVKMCMDFFDLQPDFPIASLLVRNAAGAPLRSIYFTSALVRSLLLSNTYSRMRLISCGIKIFTRQDSSGKDAIYRCKWRVMSEGLEVLRPFMGPKRIITASLSTLKVLMGCLNMVYADMEEKAFVQRLDEMESGSCVLEVWARGEGVTFEQKLVLPLWKSKVSCSLMVEKLEKSALSLRLFGEDITPHKPAEKGREKTTTDTSAVATPIEISDTADDATVDERIGASSVNVIAAVDVVDAVAAEGA